MTERLGNPLGSDPQRNGAVFPAYSAASPFPRGEQRKMRDIKGKIFLCPLIGGCRGNTRATSASNYFQTLRIERALPRAAGIARHTHFSTVSIVSIACTAGQRRRKPPPPSPLLATPRRASPPPLASPLSSTLPLSLPPSLPLSLSARHRALLSRVLIVDSRATTPRERETENASQEQVARGGVEPVTG